MNERIRELAEQAAWRTRMTHNNAYWRMQEMAEDITWREKFAMLIVQECIAMCDAAADNCADQVMPLMADKLVVAGAKEQAAKLSQCIKDYFGVEE